MAGVQAGRLSIEIVAEIARLQQDLDRAKRAVKNASGDISRHARAANDNAASSARGASQAFSEMGVSAARAGRSMLSMVAGAVGITSVGVALTGAVVHATAFADAMAEVSTLVDTASVSMAELSQTALEQARAFGAAPVDQARALYQIISAGATTAAQATETLTAANKLAIGGVTDVKTAADGLTSVMNAYGGAAGTATNVSDSMFIAMRAGKTTIGELSASLGSVAPLASQLGVSIDELNAATAALTKGGISTSEAMTGLRAVMAAVAKPSSEAAEMAERLGIQFNTAGLEAKGLGGFLQDLVQRTGGNQEAMAQLFGGVEALVPVLALAGQAGIDFADIMADMEQKAGATEEAFDKMSQSPGFQINQMLANIKAEAIELGMQLLQALVPAMAFLNENFDRGVNLVKAVVAGLAIYKGAALASAGATAIMNSQFGIRIALLASTSTQLGILTTAKIAATTAATGMAAAFRALTAALIANPFTAVAVGLAALTTGMIAFGNETDGARQKTMGLIDSLRGLATARGHQYALAKVEATIARDAMVEEIALIEERDKLRSRSGFLAGGMPGARANSKELQQLKWDLVKANGELTAADHAYRAAEQAAADMANATVQTTVATAAATTATNTRTAAISDEQKALNDRNKQTADFIGGVEDEIAKIGLNAAQLRQLEVARASEAAVTDDQRKRIDELNAAREEAIATQERQAAAEKAREADADMEQLLQGLRDELQLLGLVGEERERAALAMEKTVFIAKAIASGVSDANAAWAQYLDLKTQIIDGENALRADEQAVRNMLDNLDAVANRASSIGSIFANAFGGIGDVIGGAVARMADMTAAQAELAEQVERGARTQMSADMELASLRARNTSEMLGGIKSLFKEHSAGYKVMSAIEKAHAAMQMVNAIRGMVMDKAQTASSVSNSGLRAAADGAAAVAKAIASLPFPLNIAAGAATAAALVAFGVKMFGGSGGGGNASAPPASAQDVQARVGTGTVLGDTAAQSESIARSLGIIANNTNDDLEYANESVRHLRNISTGIGNLTAQIGRQFGVGSGGMFDTGSFKLGESSKSGFLGLFGSSTTRTLYDQGLQIFDQSVGGILAGRFSAQTYSIVEQVKKKSGFLGIGGGTKTTYSTATGAVNGEILKQFGLIVDDIAGSIVSFADQLGFTMAGGIENLLNNQTLPGLKLSFEGMSGEQIETALEAYFSSVADVMAGVLDGQLGLRSLQRAGEGLYETLARVTRTIMTVDTSLRSIGMASALGGNTAVNARLSISLADEFGGLDEMQSALSSFAAKFLTEAERMQPIIDAVGAEMERLGHAGVTTNEQFKDLVRGLDLSTEAGRQLFAELLSVAPAFSKVTEYLESLGETAEVVKQRRQLEIQLMQAQGDEAGALAAQRELELEATHESLRALKSQVWAAQDAAQAAEQLRSAWKSATDGIMDEVQRIRGLIGADGAESFASLMSQFNAATAAARGGDAEAAKNLPRLSQDLLRVAELNATSRQELDRVRAQAAASLEATNAAIGAMAGSDPAALAVAAAQQAASANDNLSAALTETNRSLREELAQMRAEMKSGLAAVAGNTGRVARKLDDVTAASGGDAIATVAVA
tara:strand:+ start:19056 stop:23858 length:4803 start_codon:yes stop_codon:yes gene_type:complete